MQCGFGITVDVDINAAGDKDGEVTGSVIFFHPGFPPEGSQIQVTDGTTDGNTFSLAGESDLCGGAFTLSGNCGTSVAVSYEDEGVSGGGTFTGDVECTLA